MEVSEHFIGGYFGDGVDQFSHEKHHTETKPGDQFAVDELLDFSNDDATTTSDGLYHNVAWNSTDSSNVAAVGSCNSSVSGGDNHLSQGFADSQFSGELCFPHEDAAELEWLSNFVEDSFSTEDELKTLRLLCGTTAVTADKAGVKPQTPESSSSGETPQKLSPFFHPETPLPGKARSKRSRAAPGDWSTRLLHVVNPTTPSSTTTAEPVTIDPKTVQPKTTLVRKRENPNSEVDSGRKCLHCAAEKTPQWRTGPMGPKTLCNACGVRYKSGRLVPEYRPAASPTFVSTKHSNSHRKVMELRRQKEMLRQQHEQQQHFLSQTSIFGVSNVGDDYLIHHRSEPDYRHVI